MPKCLLWLALLFATFSTHAQGYVERDIRSFGAKGDGVSDDQPAFEKAAWFFNKRGGQGKLVISKGIYLVGRQAFRQPGKKLYHGMDVLYLTGVRQLTISGEEGSLIRFKDSLRFGAFDSLSGKPISHPTNSLKGHNNVGFIGNAIYIGHSKGVKIQNIQLDGNNEHFLLGGADTDGDRQLAHYGIYIQDSRDVVIENTRAHHFGLDGICIANGSSKTSDRIQLRHCLFDSNARQGLSWIGGNGLQVQDCHFDGTGQGRFRSAPGAGVDIEAEEGAIVNGLFERCTFINNKRFGLVAFSGDSRACTFIDCTFWGVDSWALWVTHPAFRFLRCQVFGALVSGHDAESNADATTFQQCLFEDRPFGNKPAYGDYLVESNNKRRMRFDDCRFISHRAKLIWVSGEAGSPADYYRFTNCTMIIENDNLPEGDFAAYFKGASLKGCTFRFTHKAARVKGYTIAGLGTTAVTDGGGNNIRYQ